jgi:hypothetical protein
MTVEQGCFEVNQAMLNAGSHTATVSVAPAQTLAMVRRGKAHPFLGVGPRLLDKPVTVSGTTLTFSMKGERVGNCICWTAYLP